MPAVQDNAGRDTELGTLVCVGFRVSGFRGLSVQRLQVCRFDGWDFSFSPSLGCRVQGFWPSGFGLFWGLGFVCRALRSSAFGNDAVSCELFSSPQPHRNSEDRTLHPLPEGNIGASIITYIILGGSLL